MASRLSSTESKIRPSSSAGVRAFLAGPASSRRTRRHKKKAATTAAHDPASDASVNHSTLHPPAQPIPLHTLMSR